MSIIERWLHSRAAGRAAKWPLPLAAAALLGGCATGLSLDGGQGALHLNWVEPHTAVIQYDGKRYVGPWAGEPCSAELCGDVYRQTSRLHQRHLRRGHAVLLADDGSRLECDWISHLPEVDGTCHTADGRSFRLQGAGGPERPD